MKTVKFILFFTAFILSNWACADAYKCIKDGRPVYQGIPCEVNSSKGKLDIKDQTPEEKAMALERLKEIRREYDASQTPAKPDNLAPPSNGGGAEAPAEMQEADQTQE